MFGARSLSRAAVRGNVKSIPAVKHISSARSLSSIASRPVLASGPSARLRLKANSYLPPGLSSSARFNSTSSAGSSEAAAGGASENALPELEGLIPSIEEIPERLGYLKELGLDYGWGPSAFMEWTIEHIHILSGMPWWASIVAVGVLTRLALFKPSLMAADNSAKAIPVRDQVAVLRKQRLQLMSQGQHLEAAKAKVEMDDVYRNNNIAMWKSFLPLLQIPLGFGTFRVVRGMGTLPVPALSTEEFAWIHDFTSYDPLYVVPVVTSAFMYLAMKKGTASGANDLQATSLGRSLIKGLPAVSLLFIMWQPAALQLYFATSGFLALVQAYLINTPATRSWLGVAPIKPVQAIEAAQPQSGIRMINREELITTLRKQQEEQTAAAAAAAAAAASSSEVSASSTKPENVSLIDKMVNNAKKEFSTMREEMSSKVGEITGTANADADGRPKPRLSDAEKDDAASYKSVREIDDARIIAETNRQRMKEYEETQHRQTVNSWQDIRKKAKEAAAAKSRSTSTSSTKSRSKSKGRK